MGERVAKLLEMASLHSTVAGNPNRVSVTDPTHAAGDDASRAEILLWQSRFRMGLAVAIAGLALLLRALGVVSAHAVGTKWLGVAAASTGFAATATAYLLFIWAVRWRVRSRKASSTTEVQVVLGVDVVVVHACALLLTPPAQYDRTLILSMFLVQFTQLYFGWRATLYQLTVVGICYTSIVVLARQAGALTMPSEQLWTFALFCVGALSYAWILGQQGIRVRRLTQLFDRACEGEFDEPYAVEQDKFPDHITQIGRAFNSLRGHLEAIILTDSLSGCFNRRGLSQMAAREIARGIRTKARVAVLALDVDHFKQINDEFGHLTGDEAIKEIGALLRETARAGDVVARTGGEEFTILALDTDEEGARHLSDRIVEAFRQRSFTSVRGQLPVTISLGVASDNASIRDVVRVLTARADEALYVAKRSGRNQSVLWQTGMRAFDATTGRASREMERLTD